MRVLFTGYAPVHFICFAPIARRLREEGHEVWCINEREPYAVDVSQLDLWFMSHTNSVMRDAADSFKGKTVEIFHGCSFRNAALREANAGKDAYFAWGPRMRRGLEQLGVDADKIYNVGAPKTDKLFSSEPLPLDRTMPFADNRLPVILYAPTGARHNSLETGLGIEVMEALVATGKYNILLKFHDHMKNPRMVALQWTVGPRFKIVGDPDVTKALKVADLLITDASSVANEFTLLDRPIIFLDVPELIKDAQKKGQYDFAGRRIGEIYRPDDGVAIEDMVAYAIDHEWELLMPSLRRRRAHECFYNPGRATDAATEVIKELCP